MYECTTALMQYAKERLGIKRIEAFVITEHKRKIRADVSIAIDLNGVCD